MGIKLPQGFCWKQGPFKGYSHHLAPKAATAGVLQGVICAQHRCQIPLHNRWAGNGAQLAVPFKDLQHRSNSMTRQLLGKEHYSYMGPKQLSTGLLGQIPHCLFWSLPLGSQGPKSFLLVSSTLTITLGPQPQRIGNLSNDFVLIFLGVIVEAHGDNKSRLFRLPPVPTRSG